jgi:hypothetical protein
LLAAVLIGGLIWGITRLENHGSSRPNQVVVGEPHSVLTPTPLAELKSADGAAGDGFGSSVAISGTLAVVGAPYHGSGRAYVFTDTAAGWKETAELIGSDPAGDDDFGWSVAIAGGTVVVSAPGHGNGGGRAYVFARSPVGWSRTGELVGSDTVANDRFGSSVGISGSTVVVSASNYDNSSGTVYVFSQTGSGWAQTGRLRATDTRAGDNFGYVVSLSGDSAAVGAPFHDVRSGSVAYGAIYLFTRTGSAWTLAAELRGSEQLTGHGTVGQSFALSGSTLIASTAEETNGAGRATIFNASPSGWRPGGELAVPSGVYHSGGSVALSGSTAVIGEGPSAGAYVFQSTDPGWSLSAQLYGPDLPQSPAPVAIWGTTVLVGATSHVYVFEV